MRYKVGDRVKIREDLIIGEWYGNEYHTHGMDKYKGKNAKIMKVLPHNNYYMLDIDNESYGWADEMFKNKNRGFQVVSDSMRNHKDADIQLPQRSDTRSAGYDFRTPTEVTIQPHSEAKIYTDVKAYMQDNEVLMIHVRSSIGIKKGLTLCNTTGIIDSSYYNNKSNDGNIIIALRNNTDKPVTLLAQERIAQGVFMNYLITDDDNCINQERTGGIGSSGK